MNLQVVLYSYFYVGGVIGHMTREITFKHTPEKTAVYKQASEYNTFTVRIEDVKD